MNDYHKHCMVEKIERDIPGMERLFFDRAWLLQQTYFLECRRHAEVLSKSTLKVAVGLCNEPTQKFIRSPIFF